MFFLSDAMKFLIVLALAFATVCAKDLYSHSKVSVLENEGRIVNGKAALPGQIFYMAGIGVQKRTLWTWCGGSLIANTWILTGGYCTSGALSATVFLGGTQRLTPEQKHDVPGSDIITHPYYNSQTLKNDIGLLRIPWTKETGPIGIVKIPTNNDNNYIKELAVISGWGITGHGAKRLNPLLQYAVLTVSPQKVCAAAYPLFYDMESEMCVDTPDLVSACNGDNGGPLVLNGQNIQIGIYSYGYRDGCEWRKPIVFTRVSYHLLWIRSQTGIGQ